MNTTQKSNKSQFVVQTRACDLCRQCKEAKQHWKPLLCVCTTNAHDFYDPMRAYGFNGQTKHNNATHTAYHEHRPIAQNKNHHAANALHSTDMVMSGYALLLLNQQSTWSALRETLPFYNSGAYDSHTCVKHTQFVSLWFQHRHQIKWTINCDGNGVCVCMVWS